MGNPISVFGKQAGFSMVELMITMVIFVLTIAAASSLFVPLLTQFKQQSRIAETQIEGIVGLEILRRDLELAGFGLPWVIPAAVNYQEAANAPASGYNDSPANPPRAILSGNEVPCVALNCSDYLVIKATSVGLDAAATKWSDVMGTGGGNRIVKQWGQPLPSPLEDLNPGERVIVLIPSRGVANQRILVNNGATFFTTYPNNPTAFAPEFSPATAGDVYLIYGVDPATNLWMPFNRADYFISNVNVPPRCATSTGVLTKSVVSHNGGTFPPGNVQALLDCVADMRVIYGRDPADGGPTDGDVISGLSAPEIRNQVREVRVYILSHEGQKDASYDASTLYPGGIVRVGEFGLERNFNLSGITDWQRYRWKVYTLVVKPKNLR